MLKDQKKVTSEDEIEINMHKGGGWSGIFTEI